MKGDGSARRGRKGREGEDEEEEEGGPSFYHPSILIRYEDLISFHQVYLSPWV